MIVALGCVTTTVPPSDPDLGLPSDGAARDLSGDGDLACTPDGTLGAPCVGDGECNDGCFCNGVEQCAGGLCARGTDPCDDGVECTLSACDEASARCVAPALDDALCDDDEPCNGAESCTPAGCAAGEALLCDDGDACTVDACAPGAGCTFLAFEDPCAPPVGCMTPLPDPPACCFPDEVCGNGRDDDCNGFVDLDDDACPTANDTCATAQLLAGTGTYRFSTRGAAFDRTSACSVSGSSPLRDVVFRFELTETSNVRAFVDADGVLELRGPGPESACVGDFAAERDFLQCLPRVIEHDFVPAGTYWLLYTTRFEGALDLELTVGPSPARDCTPLVVPPGGGAFLGRYAGDDADGPSCGGAAGARDACFALTLTEPRAVRATLSTLDAGLRVVAGALELSGAASACEAELDGPVSVLVGNVPAGTVDFVAEALERVGVQYDLDIEVLEADVCDTCAEACVVSGGRIVLGAGGLTADAADIGCPGTVTGPDAFIAFDTTVANERVDFEVDAAADFAYALRTGSVACPLATPTVCGAGTAGVPLRDRFRVPTPGRHLVALKTVAGASGTLDVRILPTGLSLPTP